MSSDPVVIVSYARTPMGGFQGALAGASATQLGSAAVKAAVTRAGSIQMRSTRSSWAASCPPAWDRPRRARRR